MTESANIRPELRQLLEMPLQDDAEVAAVSKWLQANPNVRVIRRFDPKTLERMGSIPPGASIGAVLDTETTGRNSETDLMVELGLVTFAYNAETGEVYSVLDVYGALEDPGIPMPEDASRVNGITDEMLKGQRVNDDAVAFAIQDVDLVIAHSASFDRRIAERRFDGFQDKDWACSLSEIDWNAAGVGSAKLEFIAYQMGFFYDAHRATNDCLALLEVLRNPLPGRESGTVLAELLAARKCEQRRIWAVQAPFDAKDVLKGRGYRWSDGMAPDTEKAWYIDVPLEELEAELDWLSAEVYSRRRFSVPVDALTAQNRFSNRRHRLGRMDR